MRKLALLLALLMASHGFGKGRTFAYTMEGFVYDQATKDVLRNTSLVIGMQMVTTDDRG